MKKAERARWDRATGCRVFPLFYDSRRGMTSTNKTKQTKEVCVYVSVCVSVWEEGRGAKRVLFFFSPLCMRLLSYRLDSSENKGGY